jgi:sugar lactone lactonase YvrE
MRNVRGLRVAVIATALATIPWHAASAVTTPGQRLWDTRTDAAASLQAVAAGPDGSMVYATGSDYTGFLTIAYHADTGLPAWTSTFGTENADGATEIAVSPDGSKVFVAGLSTGATTDWDFGTIAYDAATGQKLWSKRFDGAGGPDWAGGLAVSPDGSAVAVVGRVARGPDPDHSDFYTDYATVLYDASTGAKRWSRVYRPAGLGGGAEDVVVTPSGDVIVTGTVQVDVAGPTAAVTSAYEVAGGHLLWRTVYQEDAGDIAAALALSPDATSVYVVGYAFSVATAADFAIWALDASTGAQRWRKAKDGPAGGYDQALAVATGPDGTIYATGFSDGVGTDDDFLTMAYEPSQGGKVWAARYNGPVGSYDDGNRIVVSPDGSKVVVTGLSAGPQGSREAATISYRAASGHVRWTKRFDGKTTATDSLNGLAIAPDSSTVYVTGYEDLDKAITIAYSA